MGQRAARGFGQAEVFDIAGDSAEEVEEEGGGEEAVEAKNSAALRVEGYAADARFEEKAVEAKNSAVLRGEDKAAEAVVGKTNADIGKHLNDPKGNPNSMGMSGGHGAGVGSPGSAFVVCVRIA